MKARVILHADLNNFYASVACLVQPELKEIPLAVCGDPQMRHGIVLAKNGLAKAMGVKTGQVIWQARQLCPNLETIPPSYESILSYSQRVRRIFARYTDHIQPFGLDEAWLDVSEAGMSLEQGTRVANHLRHAVREETGLTLSVGVSDNRIFAKLGSDLKKPDAVSVVSQANRKTVLDPLPVGELVFVGRSITSKLNAIGIYTVGQLAAADPQMLKALFGKTGLMISGFARGNDETSLMAAEEVARVKSVGNSMTTPQDILTLEDARITLYGLCESVASRMQGQQVMGQTVQLSLRDIQLHTVQRQQRLGLATDCSFELFAAAYALLQETWQAGTPLRSLGVSVSGLIAAGSAWQLTFLPEDQQRQKRKLLEYAVEGIREKYGRFAIQRAIMLSDRSLGPVHPQREQGLAPET